MARLTFDELLELGARKPPQELKVQALGGRSVWIREPSSAEADEWRVYCQKHQGQSVPFFAKLVSLMLCDEDGKRVVPEGDAALAALAAGSSAWIDEVGRACLPYVKEPTIDDVEEIQKN